jgi:predicted transcriptional regulator
MEPSANASGVSRGLNQVLGDLEAEIMECMWEKSQASVRDVHACLLKRRDIAYTTVMTVMSRLAEKGHLERQQEGRAYIYAPRKTRDAFCTDVVKKMMSGLFGRVDKPVLTHFVDSLTAEDASRLDALAEIIEQKRQERAQ